MKTFLDVLNDHVIVYDGAMGTNIQKHDLTVDDFWSKEGCNELLTLSRPDVIRSVHASFLEAGSDVIETNSFGSSRIVLAEYQLEEKTRELNVAAARLAREVAAEFSTAAKPRFVAGSIGPTTKLPSLGHITYDDMAAAYREQIEALIEGGVDILLIETCQDLLQGKIALAACEDAMRAAGRRLPIQMQVTLEATGTMLLGSEIGAALAALECFQPDIIGLNCATGPREMNDAVRFLCQNATRPVSVLPNAGLPQNVGGHAVYALEPKELARYQKQFVEEYGVRVVGGCCGTTPEHLKAVAQAVENLAPAVSHAKPQSVLASAFSALPLEVDAQPIIVAEEMNTTTRNTAFREMVRSGDTDGILALAKKLAAEGSQMIDLCCAVVGEDEKAYMNQVLDKIATRIPTPLSIDSTEADVVEEALKRNPGKALINSVNLEDGEKRTSKVLPMARRYGAAVIALTIDEDGMALTAAKKLAVAQRIFKLATEKYGMRPQDIVFDPLTLPISTGQEDYRTAAIETIEAVHLIKQELPGSKTILGVSNISFGLSTYSRRVLNSVFLKEAVDRGLDMAIVNYSKIYPLYKIPEREVELARKLIFHDRSEGDPLQVYMAYFASLDKDANVQAEEEAVEALTIEDKLKQLIIRGERSIGAGAEKQSLEQSLEVALQTYTPLDLINTVLLDGMKTVGELFGARKMQLPSVLDSASVMKAAVGYLEPKMERVEGSERGTIVLATVKGDVHDIGKNLVDIILSNNGYKVVNLGIKQTSDAIIHAAREHKAHAIGLSGLLVKSTLEMKYVVQDLQHQESEFPVICGGAALTRKYVEDDLRREYHGPVYYAEDAFAGLHVMTDLTAEDAAMRDSRLEEGRTVKEFLRRTPSPEELAALPVSTKRSHVVQDAPNIPVPPFYGVRVHSEFPMDELFGFINETALFKNQWQLKTASATDYVRLVEEKYRPILRGLIDEAKRDGWLAPKTVRGYFPCNADGNDLIVYAPEAAAPEAAGSDQSKQELLRITFPRQREGRQLSIADFFLPVDSGRLDVIGFAVVTMGPQASQMTKKLFDEGDFTKYLYAHGLGVETAEALAEWTHKQIRAELGIGDEDATEVRDLFHQKYRGSRYSFGFPACPNLEDQAKLFALLRPEETIGVHLTEGYLIEPEQSTSALVVHHPQAKYFVV